MRFPTSAHPTVSIIITATGRAPHLLECLDSVALNVRDTPYEVILVLNGAGQEVVSEVARHVEGAHVIASRVNRGFAGGCNLGAMAATSDYLLLLNDDTVVEPDWLESLVVACERRPRIGAVGSRLLHPDGTLQEAGQILWSDGSTSCVGRDAPADVARLRVGETRRLLLGLIAARPPIHLGTTRRARRIVLSGLLRGCGPVPPDCRRRRRGLVRADVTGPPPRVSQQLSGVQEVPDREESSTIALLAGNVFLLTATPRNQISRGRGQRRARRDGQSDPGAHNRRSHSRPGSRGGISTDVRLRHRTGRHRAVPRRTPAHLYNRRRLDPLRTGWDRNRP